MKLLKILKKLQENGKITNLQLSEEIGLSPAPTLERVRKLEKSAIITGYHATVDEAMLGMGKTDGGSGGSKNKQNFLWQC